MTIRVASAWLVAFDVVAGSAWAQEAGTDDVQQGHRLAILILRELSYRCERSAI